MTDGLKAYFLSKGYADHVVNAGLARLIRSWADIARSLSNSDPAYIMYDEFLNDMDGRRILEEALSVISPEERAAVQSQVDEADKVFRESTVEISKCIWGEDNVKKHGYSSEKDWYYYRRPKEVDDSWPSDLIKNEV